MKRSRIAQNGVYRIRNLINSKIYIGSAACQDGFRGRWYRHRRRLSTKSHANPKLQNAWNKHGADAFVFEVLLYCSPQDCLIYEQTALDYYKPEYNICLVADSTLGRKHTTEAKCKMSEWQKGERGYWYGKRLSEETRRKISHSNKGKVFSQEHREKIGRSSSIRNRGANHPHAKLDDNKILQIRKQLGDGVKMSELADRYNVSISTIKDIKHYRSWRHLLPIGIKL